MVMCLKKHYLCNMKMQLFERFRFEFEQADWSYNSESALSDTLIELHTDLLNLDY